MAIEPLPTVKAIGRKPVGEILWLAVTVVEFAVIMGIVCWPLSAELLPRLATGAASANRSVSVAPATSTEHGCRALSDLQRQPAPPAGCIAAECGSGLAVEGSSGGALTTALGAQARLERVQPSPGDIGGLAPAARRPQQARSDSATRKKAASPSRPASNFDTADSQRSGLVVEKGCGMFGGKCSTRAGGAA